MDYPETSSSITSLSVHKFRDETSAQACMLRISSEGNKGFVHDCSAQVTNENRSRNYRQLHIFCQKPGRHSIPSLPTKLRVLPSCQMYAYQVPGSQSTPRSPS